jgi:hypothetical protein
MDIQGLAVSDGVPFGIILSEVLVGVPDVFEAAGIIVKEDLDVVVPISDILCRDCRRP